MVWYLCNIYVLHCHSAASIYLSVVLLKNAAASNTRTRTHTHTHTHTNTECKDVWCWLWVCSSCSANYCVTVFKMQSSRCERRKWQRWVECWSHLWITHTHTHTHTHTQTKPPGSSVNSCCLSLSPSLPWHTLWYLLENLESFSTSRARTKHRLRSPFLLRGSNVSCRGFRTVRAIVPVSLSSRPYVY